MTLGVFMPGQMTLLPWAWLIGKLGLSNTDRGAGADPHASRGCPSRRSSAATTTSTCRTTSIKAARIDGAGFWRIFRKIILPLSPPILIVTVIWQFTGIWNEFLFAVVFSSGRQQPITAALIALSAGGTTVRQLDVLSAAVLIARAAAAPRLFLRRPLFHPRPDPGCDQVAMASLSVRNLSKSFGAVEVLKGIDLEVETGEFIVLVGPSGCGKSTLLAMIAGLETVTSGDDRHRRTRGQPACRRRTATSPWCSSPTRSTRP